MTKGVFALILINVLLTSMAQIVLKAGMSNSAVLHSLAEGTRWTATVTVASNPLVAFGLLMYVGSAIVWLLILSRIEVSLAYPFVGLGFLVTMLFGWIVFDDTMSPERIGGTLLIAIGVAVLARS